MHSTLSIRDLSLTLPHKICFENFNADISYGDKIALIGQNGAGKSTLLNQIKVLAAQSGINFGFVPQIPEPTDPLLKNKSGGEQFNLLLSQALSSHPDCLFLDEPTNHLDLQNKKSLFKFLEHFPGTVLLIAHDPGLLSQNFFNTFWHLENQKIRIFMGKYQDYKNLLTQEKMNLENQKKLLKQAQEQAHESLMKEQVRAKNSKQKGQKSIENKKWPTVTSKTKAGRAQESALKKSKQIREGQEALSEELKNYFIHEEIKPTFTLSPELSLLVKTPRVLFNIFNGSIGYEKNQPLLSNIFLSIQSGDRVCFIGNNGSGKSTLLKALLGDSNLFKTGEWLLEPHKNIGYFDQHYSLFHSDKISKNPPLEFLKNLSPDWTEAELRTHLATFLFRKTEEVNTPISKLSGGELARLALAVIAIKTPAVLFLDEITNNLDLETRAHVIEVLKSYPGTLVTISHDPDFLEAIGINAQIEVSDFYQKPTDR